MKTASTQLYDALFEFANQAGSWRDVRHLQVLVWMVVGLIQEKTVNLSAWVDSVQSRALYAQSTQRRFSRWFHNGRIQAYRSYAPLKRPSFSRLARARAVCGTGHDDAVGAVLRAAPVVGIPRTSHPSGMAGIESCQQQCLVLHLPSAAGTGCDATEPADVEVVLLGDRGFSNQAMIAWVKQQPGWHYHLRLKGTCWFCYRGQWRQLQQIHLAAGQAVLLHSVTLFKRPNLAGVHLAMARDPVSGNFWAVVSSRPTTLQTFWDYGLRFNIEENFLDDKSNCFQLEASGLRHRQALGRLMLVLAVATLFLTNARYCLGALGQPTLG